MSNGEVLAELTLTKVVVRDLDSQAAFYRSVCGFGDGERFRFAIAGRDLEQILFRTSGPGGALALLRFLDDTLVAPGGVIPTFSTEDIEAFQDRVLTAGGRVVQAIKAVDLGVRKSRLGFFADPEGVWLEVMER